MTMYLEGRKMAEISKELQIPPRTLYNWRREMDWDKYKRVGNISIAKVVELQLYQMIHDMADNDLMGDPSEVDKLAKLTKVLDRLNPSRQVYNSLFTFLQAITEYVNRSRDTELVSAWKMHIEPISEHLKTKFAPRE